MLKSTYSGLDRTGLIKFESPFDFLGQWGYCSEDCTGEKPDYESEYNLAMRPDLWTTGLFDLSTWSLISLAWSCDHPMGGQYSCHVTWLDQ